MSSVVSINSQQGFTRMDNDLYEALNVMFAFH